VRHALQAAALHQQPPALVHHAVAPPRSHRQVGEQSIGLEDERTAHANTGRARRPPCDLEPKEKGRGLEPKEKGRGLEPKEKGRGLEPKEKGRGLEPKGRGRGLGQAGWAVAPWSFQATLAARGPGPLRCPGAPGLCVLTTGLLKGTSQGLSLRSSRSPLQAAAHRAQQPGRGAQKHAGEERGIRNSWGQRESAQGPKHLSPWASACPLPCRPQGVRTRHRGLATRTSCATCSTPASRMVSPGLRQAQHTRHHQEGRAEKTPLQGLTRRTGHALRGSDPRALGPGRMRTLQRPRPGHLSPPGAPQLSASAAQSAGCPGSRLTRRPPAQTEWWGTQCATPQRPRPPPLRGQLWGAHSWSCRAWGLPRGPGPTQGLTQGLTQGPTQDSTPGQTCSHRRWSRLSCLQRRHTLPATKRSVAAHDRASRGLREDGRGGSAKEESSEQCPRRDQARGALPHDHTRQRHGEQCPGIYPA